jgi:hypothetical protein
MGIAGPKLKRELQAMGAVEFEQFVADLWAEKGWETAVTQQGQDAGVDVVATKTDPVDQKMVIQAKRYAEDNTVGAPAVQQYSALKKQENADVVAIVTTSSFTEPAKKQAENLDVRLVGGEEIANMANERETAETVQEYASQNRESVTDPRDLAGEVVTRLRLTRGLPYLGFLAGAIVLLWVGLYGTIPASSTVMWFGWGLVPIAAWLYTKAVPEASLTRSELAALVVLPLVFGPYYLYQEF